MTKVAISGGFDPLHLGHAFLIKEAAMYGDVVVILNNNDWLMAKKGFVFMDELERQGILICMKGVVEVLRTFHEPNPKDMSVARELRILRPDIFCQGGDRKEGCIPTIEEEVCKELGIQIIYNVGGEKIQSSSELAKGCRQILEGK